MITKKILKKSKTDGKREEKPTSSIANDKDSG